MTCIKEWNEPCPYYHMRPNCPEPCQYNKSDKTEHHCGECAYFAYATMKTIDKEKMVEYFKNIIKCNSRWENLEPYYRGVNAACEAAIQELRQKAGE